jgi:hypothetical protein
MFKRELVLVGNKIFLVAADLTELRCLQTVVPSVVELCLLPSFITGIKTK